MSTDLMFASESCPLVSSGTMKDLGLEGSEDVILVKCFDVGSKILTRGLVIKPNTCINKIIVQSKKNILHIYQFVSNELQLLTHQYLTTVLKRTTVIVLVIMYALARRSLWPVLLNCMCTQIRSSSESEKTVTSFQRVSQNINAQLCQNMFPGFELSDLIVTLVKSIDSSKAATLVHKNRSFLCLAKKKTMD